MHLCHGHPGQRCNPRHASAAPFLAAWFVELSPLSMYRGDPAKISGHVAKRCSYSSYAECDLKTSRRYSTLNLPWTIHVHGSVAAERRVSSTINGVHRSLASVFRAAVYDRAESESTYTRSPNRQLYRYEFSGLESRVRRSASGNDARGPKVFPFSQFRYVIEAAGSKVLFVRQSSSHCSFTRCIFENSRAELAIPPVGAATA